MFFIYIFSSKRISIPMYKFHEKFSSPINSLRPIKVRVSFRLQAFEESIRFSVSIANMKSSLRRPCGYISGMKRYLGIFSRCVLVSGVRSQVWEQRKSRNCPDAADNSIWRENVCSSMRRKLRKFLAQTFIANRGWCSLFLIYIDVGTIGVQKFHKRNPFFVRINILTKRDMFLKYRT